MGSDPVFFGDGRDKVTEAGIMLTGASCAGFCHLRSYIKYSMDPFS